LWWLAGHEEDQLGGTLTYNPIDGVTLDLLGILGDLATALNHSLGGADDDYQTIHGVTTRGKPVTLLGAFAKKRQLNMPGIANETWTSNMLVVGIHLTNADDDALFDKSYFRFEGIEHWLEHEPFSDCYDHDSRKLTVTAAKPREVPFADHTDFKVSSVGSLYTNRKPETRFGIDVISQMAITPDEPRPLNWHFIRAGRLQELASLCAGHYLPLLSFELRGPHEPLGGGGTRPSEAHVYARMIHAEMGSRPEHERPVITGPELARFSPQAVQLWFDQYEIFSPAISLFFTISGQRKMFTNIRMLLAIQALEVFHRRTSSATIMPPSEFDEFSKGLIEGIPENASGSMRDKLKSLYVYCNEPSLGQRLKAIIADLTEAFMEGPAGFDKAFLRKLVDTRNYYTHFSAELRDKALDGEGMYWASRRVILLLTLLFLQRLGVAASDIAPLLRRHQEFSRLWSNAGYPC
jgi:hypothetical protein